MSHEIDRDSAAAQADNVAPLTGSQSAAPDPLLQAEAAMSEAVAEIEGADGNGRTVAQLIEAREAIRSEYRNRGQSESSAHTLTGSDAIDAIDAQHREQEMHKRIDRVLGPGFCNLADYLRTGQPHGLDPHRELIDHATALAEVLSHVDTKSDEITDAAVPRATHLLYALLYIARTVGDSEKELEIAQYKARRNGEEGDRHA